MLEPADLPVLRELRPPVRLGVLGVFPKLLIVAGIGACRGVSKNHAMNTAKVSTLLDILLSHRGPTREQDRRGLSSAMRYTCWRTVRNGFSV